MKQLTPTFPFRARDRILVTFGPFFFGFMWFVVYRTPGNDRSLYLWVFGGLTLAYVFAAWYYDRFRYRVTPDGLWHTPALRPRIVRWDDVAEAQLFETTLLIFILRKGKRLVLPLASVDHPTALLDVIQHYIPAERFRPAAPPSLVHLRRLVPVAGPFALGGSLIGLWVGDTPTLLLGLAIGAVGSAYLSVGWYYERRTGRPNRSLNMVLWVILFIPSFTVALNSAGTGIVQFRRMLVFFAGAMVILLLTALSALYFLSGHSNVQATTER
jgi:hypothetical protein